MNTFVITELDVYQLCIYTTLLLNNKQDELAGIKWTNGEANIDTEYSKLSCECCILAWDIMKQKYPKYIDINMICVIPDINITFLYPNGKKTKHKIELKSSKSKKMLGSTIKNLNINQSLIYCLRPSNKSEIYKVKCSQYHYAMGYSNTDLFQDRTPRPFLNFENMNEVDNILHFEIKDKECWIEHYATCGLNRIDELIPCQKSWQDDMIKIMKKKIIEEYVKNTSHEQFKVDKILLLTKKYKDLIKMTFT